MRKSLCALALCLALASFAGPQPGSIYTAPAQEALGRISQDSLRGNLSFLASDALEGRDTPSRGLDIAAEFIAAQFRKARLEPAGDDGYFQTARFLLSKSKPETFELKLESGGRTVTVTDQVTVQSAAGLAIHNAPALAATMEGAVPAGAAGKVVFLEWSGGRAGAAFARIRALRSLKPALVVVLDPGGRLNREPSESRLVDPEERAASAPWVSVRNEELAKALKAGLAGATVSVLLEAPQETEVKLRNVVGLLRGSDPMLRDTYILVTAHYDHVGMKPGCTAGDCIYNGANDNGSGTVSVIETAAALASLKDRPRRSIVFMTVFGEEEGGYGARYYTRHPIFPLNKTVADVNLEQLGRTDAADGPQVATATFTGFDFSSLPKTFEAAGKLTGIKIYKTASSDLYFSRSDNQTFANAGIPAHTMCVAYEYPDYHGLADTWDKIDYANMARVDRMLALGILMLADSATAPRWNESNSRTAPYVEAWKRLTAAPAAGSATSAQ